ncbi:MAG: c-type cytochrome [Verrucomicrobia bacterium]|nr:c-type cytochrome [Verrucomicrobiota bacterium]
MRILLSALFAISFSATGFAQDKPPAIDPARDLPSFPAVEVADAVGTFQIKPGFRLELIASEPLVVDPIALSFDEDGRLFVIEMRDYSERRDERLGRVKMLEDTNGDGRFDKSTVYAEGLPWPTAIICYGGGVFVGSTPDVFYFKDTNGDGKADIRQLIYNGFGNTKSRLNVQALLNSFNWSLDNRIHGLSASNGGIVTNMIRKTDKPLDLNNRNFSFDPRTFEMIAESGGGQYGMSFDSRGRKFSSSNSEHLMAWMYEGRYGDRNPYYAMPKALVSIAVDGGAAEVYRISPEEPWRVIRTKWRKEGVVKGVVEGGGRASGYFTGATGATIYRGNTFPPEFMDNAFTADSGGNLMHRKIVSQEGLDLKAARPKDEQDFEFLASRDTWFRPTQFANGPDGCFYVIDMYREIIEHPWSLPEEIKQYLDLNNGNDRGRIYRIVPNGFKQPKIPRLSKAKTAQLVSTLEHANGWYRDTSARLLFERQDKMASHALGKMVEKSKSPYARMHALYALAGLEMLREGHVLTALKDENELVRQHAVRLAEKVLSNGTPSSALWAQLRQMPADVSINVVYQLAFTLGELQHAERNAALAECLARDFGSQWMRAAVLSSLANGAGEMFSIVSVDPKFVSDAKGRQFLSELAKMIGAKNDKEEVNRVGAFLGQSVEPMLAFSLVRAIGEGLERAKSSLAQLPQTGLKNLSQIAVQTVKDPSAAAPVRLEAIALLGLLPEDFSGVLISLLELNQPQVIQLAAVNALGRFDQARVADQMVQRWGNFTPRVRDEAVTMLLARPARAGVLLDAVQRGTIARSQLNSTQEKFLRTHRDKTIQAKANAVLVEVTSQRQDVIDTYMPSVELKGDLLNGQVIYMERCAACHQFAGQGFTLGPDLITVQSTGKDKLLLSILDPNAEVAPQFQAYEVETADGESLIGMIVNETANSVTIRAAYGKEDVVPRSNIKKMQSQQQSLMPEGLEGGLTPEQMADLLDYITTAKVQK